MLHVGARFAFDGEAVEVVALDGARVTTREARGTWRTVGMATFVAGATSATPVAEVAVGPLLIGGGEAHAATSLLCAYVGPMRNDSSPGVPLAEVRYRNHRPDVAVDASARRDLDAT
jgi:hypothetical protein